MKIFFSKIKYPKTSQMSKISNTTKYLVVGVSSKHLYDKEEDEDIYIPYHLKVVVKKTLFTKQGKINHGQMFLSDEFPSGAIYIGMDLEEENLIIQDSHNSVSIVDNLNVTHIINFFLPERIEEKNLPGETKNIFMEITEKEKTIKKSLDKLNSLLRKI